MNLKAGNYQVDEISKNNFSDKSIWTEDSKGNFDIRHKVQGLLITANEENIKNSVIKKNDNLLPELEHQVQNAELRCDSLKQQLDYMKRLCHDKFDWYSTDPVNEKLFVCSEYDTFCEEKDSVRPSLTVFGNTESETKCFKLNNAVREVPEGNLCNNLANNTEESCVMESRLNSSRFFNSDDDLEDPFIYEWKHKTFETEYLMKNEKKQGNSGDSFPNEVTFHPIPFNSPENSMDAHDTTQINLVPIQSKCVCHSVSQNYEDNIKCSVMDTHEYSVQNRISSVSDTINPIFEINEKNGVVNPIKTVQQILNGITDSLSIISQLSLHASESGRKEHFKKHHIHKHISKAPTSKSIRNKEDSVEQETVKYFPIENTVNRLSCSDEQYFNEHETRQQCHYTHQDDCPSDWNTVSETDHTLIHTNFCSSEEKIQSPCLFKQNRTLCRRQRSKGKHHLQNTFKIQSHKSYPDLRNYNSKIKPKKRLGTEIESFNKIENEKSHGKDSVAERMKTLKTGSEVDSRDLTQETIKHGRTRYENSPFPTQDQRQIKRTYNTKYYDSVMKMYKKESLKSPIDSENTQKLEDKFPMNSTSKNNQKSMRALKTEIRSQISCSKNDRLFRDNPVSRGLVEKIENKSSSTVQPSYKGCSPNVLTPTFSSKLKQIDRSFMNVLNFQNIPFIVGTSTSRSHNLALNLQQTLSIIKSRNTSLSPGSDLHSELACSMIGSESCPSTPTYYSARKGFCPVAVAHTKSSHYETHKFSYKPEYKICGEIVSFHPHPSVSEIDSVSEMSESICKSPTEEEHIKQFSQISQKGSVWENDDTDDCSQSLQKKLRCTCFPTRPCMEYQKLLCEYLSNRGELHMLDDLLTSRHKREKALGMDTQQKIKGFENTRATTVGFEGAIYGQSQSPLRALKDVLMKLHEDFIKLNMKYKYLQNEMNNPNAIRKQSRKELEILEKELNSKEKDIIDILELHKELKSLNQQVKALRKKADDQEFVTKPPSNILRRDSTTSTRLTRLLRTIQKFQEKLLNE